MSELAQRSGRYDSAARRRSQRHGPERGVWVYIPAVELAAAGIGPAHPPPFYRVWGRQRGSVLIKLYKEG
jgi:hypothetical protein